MNRARILASLLVLAAAAPAAAEVDLRPGAVSATPTAASAGGTISITESVTAVGDPAPGFYVGWYASADRKITTADVLLGRRWVASLAKAEVSSATTSVAVPATLVGAYYVGVLVDHSELVLEADDTNNAAVGPQVTFTQPDLRLTSLTLGATTVPAGGTVAVTDTVTSTGASSGGFWIRYYASADAAITVADTALGGRWVSGLASGASSTATTALALPVTLTGSWVIGAIADADGGVVESSETDNALAGPTLTIVRPNLVPGPLTASPARLPPGGTVTLTDSVTAAGGGAAAFWVRFYASSDATVSAEDVPLGARRVSGLAAGETSTASTPVTLPAALLGPYTLGAIVDADGEVAESSEGDNVAAGTTVTIAHPDLVPGPLAVTPTAVPAGGTVTVVDSVTASGGDTAATTVQLYLSQDATITTADTPVESRTVPALADGETSQGSTAIALPVGATGTWYLGAIVDPQNAVAESDDGNNVPAPVALAIERPDLAPVALTVAPLDPPVDGTITVTDAVTATGGGSPGFRVHYYLSADAAITAADTLLGSRDVPALAAGATSDATTVLALPAGLAGVRRVGVIVDALDVVPESNEGNDALAAGAPLRIGDDGTPPAIAFSGIAAGAVTKDAPVTVCFDVADPRLATVDATLDGLPVEGCGSAYLEGDHELVVHAADVYGNEATERLAFTIDLTAPEVTLAGVEDGLVSRAAEVTLTWSATDLHPATVVATLDGVDFASGGVVSAEGEHVLAVTATDAAGNVTTRQRSFALDRIAPAIHFAGVTDGAVLPGDVTPDVTASDDHLASLTVTVDGAPWTAGTPVLAEGPHVLAATARDLAGNERVEQLTFTIDRTAPSVAFGEPDDGTVTATAAVEVRVTATDAVGVAGVTLNGVAMTHAADGSFTLSWVLGEGPNVLEARAVDLAGNPATATVTVRLDTGKPELVVTSPAEGAVLASDQVTVSGRATDVGGAVTLTVDGAPVVLAVDGGFSTTVTLGTGEHDLTLVATDAAGNVETVVRHVTVAASPPTLVVTEPPPSFVATSPSVTVRGTAASGGGGAVTVTVNGEALTLDAGGAFSKAVTISTGAVTLTFVATDAQGRTTEVVVSGTYGGAPPTEPPPAGSLALSVDSPGDRAILGSGTVAVTGRVDGGTAPYEVKVAGVRATVSAGYFQAALALVEGDHILAIEAKDAAGQVARVSRSLSIDHTPPYLAVTRPATASAEVAESPFLVQGEVGDVHLATVTVDGLAATVIGGQFSRAVPLQVGPNDVRVEARDAAGNVTTRTLSLSVAALPPTVTILEPADGTEATAAVVKVRARVEAVSALQAVTIGSGAAHEEGGLWVADYALALGENVVTVSATDANGLTGSSSVVVKYRDVSLEPLAVTGVDPAPGATQVEPDALVSIAFNKPVQRDSVAGHFTVRENGQAVEAGYYVAPGDQTVSLVARRPFAEDARVEVLVDGVEPAKGPGMARSHASLFTVRPRRLELVGHVLDEALQPLAGVQVSIEGTSLSTRTGAEGAWHLFNVPPGAAVVRYDGGVLDDGSALPAIRRRVFVSGTEDTDDAHVIMVPTDRASMEHVDARADVHATFAGRHGALAVDVEAGGLFFEDGKTSGFVTATKIPSFALPVPVENGRELFGGLWQVAPAGIRLTKPVQLAFPNDRGLPAGRYAILLAYDPTRHMVQRVGFGKVAADGSAIRSLEPVDVDGLDFFGYGVVDDNQQAFLETNLGGASGGAGGGGETAPGATPGGSTGFLLRDVDDVVPLWAKLLMLPLGGGRAEAFFMPPFGPLPEPQIGMAWITGKVRSPQERQYHIDVTGTLDQEVQVTLPVPPVKLKFTAKSDEVGWTPAISISMRAARGATQIAAPSNENWGVREGAGEVTVEGTVPVEVGTTLVTAQAQSLRDSRTATVEAVLVENPPDPAVIDPATGQPRRTGKLRVRKLVETEESAASEGISFFSGWPIEVTSASFVKGVTGITGSIFVPVFSYGWEQGALVCTEVQTGVRWIVNADKSDPENPKLVRYPITEGFPVCYSLWSLPPGTFSPVSLLVDMRLLTGSVNFYNRDDRAIGGACDPAAKTEWDPVTHELQSISMEDVEKTEVYFFREDDLETPIARYVMATPPVGPNGQCMVAGGHGEYKRLRFGPSERWTRRDREWCDEARLNGQTTSDEYRWKCEGRERIQSLRLSEGDHIVVFAVNHATGYAGSTTVVVPPITTNLGLDANGHCPQDDAAGGPIEFPDFGQMLKISRCARQDIRIFGNLRLYPPEIDVRVARQVVPEGASPNAEVHLVRHGGGATVRDELIHVSTHWRVRLPPADLDRDGTPNLTDRCDREPGPPSNFGCPDPANPGWTPPPPPQEAPVEPPAVPTVGLPGTGGFAGAPGPAVDPFDADGDGIPDVAYDRDGDGTIDAADRCPLLRGDTASQGCPAGVDTDHDGTPDAQETAECVLRPGPTSAPTPGCPDPNDPSWTPPATENPDTDGDGIADSQDLCPLYQGPAATSGSTNLNGCPSLLSRFDTDDDGVADPEDDCIWQPGPAENRGCYQAGWTPPAPPPRYPGQPGRVLEAYCSELKSPTPDQLKICRKMEDRLVDVPAGVPPLAGQVVRVTGTAVETPSIATFPIMPGRHTSDVQAGLRIKMRNDAVADPTLPDAYKTVTTNLDKANYYVHVVGNLTLFADANGDGRIDAATEVGLAPPAFHEPANPPAGWKPGLPEFAFALKNVYRSLEPDGSTVERFDRDREHEFRVIEVKKTSVTARQGDGTDRRVDAAANGLPVDAAQAGDLSYALLLNLLAPDAGRAGTLPGTYQVRLGSDDYGVPCRLQVTSTTVSATCDDAWIFDVLSGSDIVYLSLALAGNAENVLYKYNFQGLSPRRDIVTAGHETTVAKSVKPDANDGKPEVLRPVSQPALANVFLGPAQAKKANVKLCAGSCTGEGLVRELDLAWQPSGAYLVTEVAGRGVVEQVPNAGLDGASLFRIPVPPQHVHMTGLAAAGLPEPQRLFVRWRNTDDPGAETHEIDLGKAGGGFTGANARAPGQETVGGVNIVDGHLSFRHEDLALPEYASQVRFTRTYNNTDNEIGTLGTGWRHGYEAYVVEESSGRYTMILEGQSYDFPSCKVTTESDGRKSASDCETDNSHGGKLTVKERPEADPANPKHVPDVLFEAADGVHYRFDRYSQKALQLATAAAEYATASAVQEQAEYRAQTGGATAITAERPRKTLRDAGRRRWVLTAIDDGHATKDPLDATKWVSGYTAVDYVPNSDMVRRVYRKGGKVALWFEYEAVDLLSPTLSSRVKAAAQGEGFAFLKRVDAAPQVLGPDGTPKPPGRAEDVLVRVTFTRSADQRGNLRKAERSTTADKTSVDEAWEYTYIADPATPIAGAPAVDGDDRWDAVNELEKAELKFFGVVQSRSTWKRNGRPTPFPHVKPFELVDEIRLPGQGGEAVRIAFEGTKRIVTEPGAQDDTTPVAVVTVYELNAYGNANVITVRGGGSEAGDAVVQRTWESEDPKGKVVVTSETSPVGRKVSFAHDPRLRETYARLDAVGSDTMRAAGIAAGTVLLDVVPAGPEQATLDGRYGVPVEVLRPAADGTQFTERVELWDTGDVKLRKVTDSAGRPIAQHDYTHYENGVLRTEVDEAGRTITYADAVPGSAPHPLGVPEYVTITMPASPPVADGALSVAHRYVRHDTLGRVTSVSVPETGAQESWTYDAMGRVKTHQLAGTPGMSRRWDYVETDNALEVKEYVGAEETPRRKRTFADGLAATETIFYGAPEETSATRTNTYLGGTLVKVVDERGVTRRRFYDGAGRLLRGTALAAGATEEKSEFTIVPDRENRPSSAKDYNGLETRIQYDALGRAASWDRSAPGDKNVETVELDLGGAVAKRVLEGLRGSHTYTYALDPLGRVEKATSADQSVNEERTYARGQLATVIDRITELEQGFEYADVLGRLTKHWRKVQGAELTGAAEVYHTETRSYALEGGAVKVTASHSADWKDASSGGGSGANSWKEEWKEDPLGRVLSRTSYVHGVAAERKYDYDAATGELWKAWEPGATTATVYDRDRAGYLVKITDPAGYTTGYGNDAGGLRTSQTGPLPDEAWTMTYDAFGQPATRIIAAWNTTFQGKWTYAWNAGVLTEADPNGYTTERAHDAAYRVVKEVRHDDGSPSLAGTVQHTGNELRTTYEYAGASVAKKLIEEGKAKTTFTFEFDARGRERRRVEEWSAPSTIITSYGYRYEQQVDWQKRVATVTRDGNTIRLVHDSLGDVVSRKRTVYQDLGEGNTGSTDYTDSWVYDASGRLVVQRPSGLPPTRYDYQDGLLTKERFAGTREETTSYAYWATGRIHTVTQPSGSVRTYEYDGRGDVTLEKYGTASASVQTSYTYDAAGRLATLRKGSGQPWTYTHGPRGELLKVQQPGDTGAITYVYDAGARLAYVRPQGYYQPSASGAPEQQFARDYLGRERSRKVGNALWVTDWSDGKGTTTVPGNGKVHRLYDGRGRIARVSYEPSTAEAAYSVHDVDYEYTSQNQPSYVSEDGFGRTMRYHYDGRDLLETATRGASYVTYTYEDSGRIRSVTPTKWFGVVPDFDNAVQYGYDTSGRLRSVVQGPRTVWYTWADGGELITSIDDSTIHEERCYDGAGRLKQVVAVRSGTGTPTCGGSLPTNAITALGYDYDGRANRTLETRAQNNGAWVSTDQTEYGYDEADRLTGVRYGDRSADLYVLGPDGTRIGEKHVSYYDGVLGPAGFGIQSLGLFGSESRFNFDNNGQLAAEEQNWNGTWEKTRGWQFDESGRLTKNETYDPTAATLYGWDAAGRLRKAEWSSGSVSYTYEPDGLRRSRQFTASTGNEENTEYAWDDRPVSRATVLAQLDGSSEPLLYASVGPEAAYAGNARVIGDALGSPVALVEDGVTVKNWRYSPWGQYRPGSSGEYSAEPAGGETLAFTGHSWDGAPRLIYAQQRWYDPSIGRFVSRDTAEPKYGFPATTNPYLYANGNPTAFVDPNGKEPITIAVAILGAAALGVAMDSAFACVGNVAETGIVDGCAGAAAGAATAGFVSGGVQGLVEAGVSKIPGVGLAYSGVSKTRRLLMRVGSLAVTGAAGGATYAAMTGGDVGEAALVGAGFGLGGGLLADAALSAGSRSFGAKRVAAEVAEHVEPSVGAAAREAVEGVRPAPREGPGGQLEFGFMGESVPGAAPSAPALPSPALAAPNGQLGFEFGAASRGGRGYLVSDRRVERFARHAEALRSAGYAGERLAELRGRIDMLTHGFVKDAPSKLTGSFAAPGRGHGRQGFDQVFRNVFDPADLAVLESKYSAGFRVGRDDPTSLLAMTRSGAQMSQGWRDATIQRMITGPHPLRTNALGWELGDLSFRPYMNVLNADGEGVLVGLLR